MITMMIMKEKGIQEPGFRATSFANRKNSSVLEFFGSFNYSSVFRTILWFFILRFLFFGFYNYSSVLTFFSFDEE
jgi:hypothetical protein